MFTLRMNKGCDNNGGPAAVQKKKKKPEKKPEKKKRKKKSRKDYHSGLAARLQWPLIGCDVISRPGSCHLQRITLNKTAIGARIGRLGCASRLQSHASDAGKENKKDR